MYRHENPLLENSRFENVSEFIGESVSAIFVRRFGTKTIGTTSLDGGTYGTDSQGLHSMQTGKAASGVSKERDLA